MATTKPSKKTAAQKQMEKLQGQIQALKDKRKTLSEQIDAKKAELAQFKKTLKAKSDESE